MSGSAEHGFLPYTGVQQRFRDFVLRHTVEEPDLRDAQDVRAGQLSVLDNALSFPTDILKTDSYLRALGFDTDGGNGKGEGSRVVCQLRGNTLLNFFMERRPGETVVEVGTEETNDRNISDIELKSFVDNLLMAEAAGKLVAVD